MSPKDHVEQAKEELRKADLYPDPACWYRAQDAVTQAAAELDRGADADFKPAAGLALLAAKEDGGHRFEKVALALHKAARAAHPADVDDAQYDAVLTTIGKVARALGSNRASS